MVNPQRGEVWLVDLSPTIGQEMQKTRPVVVISTNLIGSIALRIIVPITSWQEKFAYRFFMVKISPTSGNGLSQESAGNVLQVRSLSNQRFIRRLGVLEEDSLQELLAGLAIITEYSPMGSASGEQ
jgi:mRNA interferase MazF